MKDNVFIKIGSWFLFLIGSAGLLYTGFEVTHLVDVLKLMATVIGSIGAIIIPIISLFRKDKKED